MTKREEYDLLFCKLQVSGRIVSRIKPAVNNAGRYANLIFINFLSTEEVHYFIDTINTIISGKLYDPGFPYCQGLESENVIFNNPNFIIDGVLIISMQDLKQLLQEWLEFMLDSEPFDFKDKK